MDSWFEKNEVGGTIWFEVRIKKQHQIIITSLKYSKNIFFRVTWLEGLRSLVLQKFFLGSMYFYIGGVGFLKPFHELTTCFHKFSKYESMNLYTKYYWICSITIGKKNRRFVFGKFVKTCRELDIFVFSFLAFTFVSSMLVPKSLYICRAVSNFYGTEFEIWVDFELVGSTENCPTYYKLLLATFQGIFFYVFMFNCLA